MSEQIRDGVVVFDFGKCDRLVEGIVEAVEIDKVYNILIGIFNFGHLAYSYDSLWLT